MHHVWRAIFRLGGLRQLQAIDFGRVARLVFICGGNICRSPYAEARARSAHLPAVSFGLDARPNCSADSTAVRVAAARGLDLRRHAAQPLRGQLFKSSDLLLAMEPGQVRRLLAIARRWGAQATLLGLWASPERAYLQDPYGLSEDYFHTCFSVIDGAISAIHRRWTPEQSKDAERRATM